MSPDQLLFEDDMHGGADFNFPPAQVSFSIKLNSEAFLPESHTS